MSKQKTDHEKIDEIHDILTSVVSGVAWAFIIAGAVLVLIMALGFWSVVHAEERTLYNDRGQEVGRVTTGRDGVSTLRNDRGQVTGTARTGRDGVTTFENSLGQQTGTARSSGGSRR